MSARPRSEAGKHPKNVPPKEKNLPEPRWKSSFAEPRLYMFVGIALWCIGYIVWIMIVRDDQSYMRKNALLIACIKSTPVFLLGVISYRTPAFVRSELFLKYGDGLTTSLFRVAPSVANYGWYVGNALYLSSLGDLLLALHDAFLPIPKAFIFFLSGLGSFLVSHVLYTVAIRQMEALGGLKLLHVLPVLAIFTVMSFCVENLKTDIPLLISTVLYSIVIANMVIHALRSYPAKRAPKYLIPAALLFAVSDSILALNMFYRTIPGSTVLVMSTYYSAQILFSLSVLEFSRKRLPELIFKDE